MSIYPKAHPLYTLTSKNKLQRINSVLLPILLSPSTAAFQPSKEGEIIYKATDHKMIGLPSCFPAP